MKYLNIFQDSVSDHSSVTQHGSIVSSLYMIGYYDNTSQHVLLSPAWPLYLRGVRSFQLHKDGTIQQYCHVSIIMRPGYWIESVWHLHLARLSLLKVLAYFPIAPFVSHQFDTRPKGTMMNFCDRFLTVLCSRFVDLQFCGSSVALPFWRLSVCHFVHRQLPCRSVDYQLLCRF